MSTSPSEDLETASIEAMERLDAEVTIDSEIGGLDEEGSNEGDDELVTIQRDRADEIRQFYAVDGEPDYFHFRVEPRHSLDGDPTTRTENDWHLKGAPPVEFFGKSQSFLARKFSGFEVRSAYDKKAHTYAPFVEEHRPVHGSTEGGKGLAMYTRPVIYLTAEMSVINNLNITFGCPASCSFCKESLLARGFTQITVNENTGVIEITFDNIDGVGPGRREVPSKTRVAFYDTDQGKIVYGPLSVAVVNQFPISTDSLEKLRKGQLTRLLAD